MLSREPWVVHRTPAFGRNLRIYKRLPRDPCRSAAADTIAQTRLFSQQCAACIGTEIRSGRVGQAGRISLEAPLAAGGLDTIVTPFKATAS